MSQRKGVLLRLKYSAKLMAVVAGLLFLGIRFLGDAHHGLYEGYTLSNAGSKAPRGDVYGMTAVALGWLYLIMGMTVLSFVPLLVREVVRLFKRDI
ncbi:MAG: hypothetical protein JST51_17950 [Armatimonadetes bacterium]|nr:hypothetical protein [Armatimonadota bacterium]